MWYLYQPSTASGSEEGQSMFTKAELALEQALVLLVYYRFMTGVPGDMLLLGCA